MFSFFKSRLAVNTCIAFVGRYDDGFLFFDVHDQKALAGARLPVYAYLQHMYALTTTGA